MVAGGGAGGAVGHASGAERSSHSMLATPTVMAASAPGSKHKDDADAIVNTCVSSVSKPTDSHR